MVRMIRKIKGLLGYCQWKGCWSRSIYELNAKDGKRLALVCKEHGKQILNDKDTRITGITANIDIKL